MSRYKFYRTPNKVICISSFAKKDVKGVATCSPNDVFDENIGKELAQLRCDIKIAKKRVNKSKRILENICNWLDYWNDKYLKYDDYFTKSIEEYETLSAKLEKMEKKLNMT